MLYYVKFMIVKNFDEILIYVGINDVGKLQFYIIVENIVDLVSFIMSEFVFCVVIFEFIIRVDDLFKEVVKEVNRRFC